MADPQPWRLNFGDPNSSSNQNPWLNINRKVAKAIASQDAAFQIVNGDLTEFGRVATYNDYENIYKKNSHRPIFEGLGNHDYANNVGNCQSYEYSLSKDGCAISAVFRMSKAMEQYKKTLQAYNYNEHKQVTSYANNLYLWKSLSYSWDYGDIHYVQLQNYPTYNVNLNALLGINHVVKVTVEKSLNWLEQDLAKADARGKITILNFHDARPSKNDKDSHFIDQSSKEDLDRFKKIITSHRVKALFVGHTHDQNFCHAEDDAVFGNVPVYTAGALFNGDYYKLDIEGTEISVKAFNGATGSPVLKKDLGLIRPDTVADVSCSNK